MGGVPHRREEHPVTLSKRAIAAAAAVTGVLGIGGVTLASAQEPTTPPSTDAPSQDEGQPAPDEDRGDDKDCPFGHDGGGGGEESDTSLTEL
jgi:hypothetical protein